jgi:hypothetical protein
VRACVLGKLTYYYNKDLDLLILHGRWFSPSTPASFATETGRHDIAESGVKHNKSNQILSITEAVFI